MWRMVDGGWCEKNLESESIGTAGVTISAVHAQGLRGGESEASHLMGTGVLREW